MREELGKAVERDLPIFFADITKEAQQNSEKYVVFFFFFYSLLLSSFLSSLIFIFPSQSQRCNHFLSLLCRISHRKHRK